MKRHNKLEKRDAKSSYKAEKKKRKTEYIDSRRRSLDAYIKEKADIISAEGKRIPTEPPKRGLLEEIGNAVTHGVGSLFSVVAFLMMLFAAEGAYEIVGACIYFFGSFVMFTMSCLYHAFPYGSAVKRLFRRFDYSSIYLLIGATFAPVLINVIGGVYGIVFIFVQWAIIITGISLVGVFGPARLKFIHMPLYIILGWSAVMLAPQMIKEAKELFIFVLVGGVIYSLGIIPFAIKARISHFIWHFFVFFGAVVQWIGIYLYIYLQA